MFKFYFLFFKKCIILIKTTNTGNAMRSFRTSLFIILIIMPIVVLIIYNYSKPVSIKAHNGYSHVEELLNEDRILKLTGTWEFYPSQFILPEEFNNKQSGKEFIDIPNKWNKALQSKYGFGTFRLMIKTGDIDSLLGFRTNRVLTSYSLWINDKLLVQTGIPAINETGTIPHFSSDIITFDPESDYCEIVIHVSNFHDPRGGGLFETFYLAKSQDIFKFRIVNIFLDSFLTGALIIFSFYHFILFAFHKNNKASLYFALETFVTGIRTPLAGDRFLISIFPNIPWEFEFKIEILTVILMTIFSMLFVRALFKGYFNEKVVSFFIIVTISLIIINLLFPAPYFIYSLLSIFVVIPLVVIYLISILYRCIRDGNYDAVLLSFGIFLYVICILNDMLYTLSIIKTGFLASQGMLFFVLIQATIMARRYTQSIIDNEKLNKQLLSNQENLYMINTNLELKVKERTKELEGKIKENDRMSDELLKSKKLEALGQLAGGIAHDFNNLLSIISGNLFLLSTDEQKFSKTDVIKDSETAIKRAIALSNQLLTFSKGGDPIKKNIDILELMESTLEMLFRNSNVEYSFFKHDNMINCMVDQSQISQVFTNILINAQQAVDTDNGRITVSMKKIFLKEDELFDMDSGLYLLITIEDNGHGIKQENMDNIFDPFFTTKTHGKGLGLATAYSIINKHDGYITVDSTYGKGTTFFIYLPLVE